jgi:hypothetical protein
MEETARGDPDALAARIVAALAEGGYCIVPANGIEDTALGPQPYPLARRRTPVFPQTGQSHPPPVGQRNRIRLLP